MNNVWEIVASNAVVASALGLVALLVGRVGRNAAATHLVWVVVLLKLFTPPLILAPLAVATVWPPTPVAPAPPRNPSTGSTSPEVRRTEPVAAINPLADGGEPFAPSGRSTGTPGQPRWSPSTILAALWLAGAGAMALVHAVRIHRFAAGLRECGPAPPALRAEVAHLAGRLGLRRVPEVLMTAHALPPLVWSLGTTPRLIVPSELFGRLSHDAQATIIAHELVHIRRGDHLVRLLELVATTVFWWHPFVWLAGSRLRDLEEECSDGRVLDLLPDHPRTYAAALVATLEFLAGPTGPPAPLRTAIGSPHSLSRRILMLTRRRPNRLSPWSAAFVAGLVTGPLAVAFAVGPEPVSLPAAQIPNPPGAPVAVLRGRVTNKEGVPLPGALVRVAIPATDMRHVDPSTDHLVLEAHADVNGDYRLELPGIAGRTTISIDAMLPGYRRLIGTLRQGGDARQVEVEPGKEVEATLPLELARYYGGVVVDEQGQPIAGVQVSANVVFDRASGGVEQTATRSNGTFDIFNYPVEPFERNNVPGKGIVYFSHPDYIAFTLEGIDAIEPDQRGSLRVVLETGRKLAGTVLDADGKPVPKALVKAGPTLSRINRKGTLTDANGRFDLRGLNKGLATLDVRAYPIKQKLQLPVLLDADKADEEVRLQPIPLPADLKTWTVLGMKLADVTPELKAAYDLYHPRGALILDPGPDSARLNIGDLAEGYEFWVVGDKRIDGLRDFVDRIIAETGGRDAAEYSVRVVYTFITPESEGTNTQYLKLTKDDIQQLRVVAEQLAAEARK